MRSDWYPDTYFPYMRSPDWRRLVADYYRRHPRRCAACRSSFDVDLHHKTYARLEAERDDDLAPLCSTCHSMVHSIHQISAGDLAQVTELWIQSFPNQPSTRGRLRATLRGVSTRPPALKQDRALIDLDGAVHVGLFSYVARRGDSFVTWSTFRRRAKVVWTSSSLERAISVSQSVDRRAQTELAGSVPAPRPPQKRPVTSRAPLPQSSGFDDVDWFVSRPTNRAPSVRVQLAKTFSRNRFRGTESFGYSKNLPSTQNYRDDA